MLTRFLLTTLTISALFTLPAQEVKKVQEPEYVKVVLYLDPTTGSLQPLERQKPNVSAKLKAFGLGGATSKIVFEGAKSPIRFKSGQEIHFVVRGLAPDIEPSSQVDLDVLAVSKDQRGIVMMKVGMVSGAKTKAGETLRPLNFTKYGEASTKFSPAQPLDPGEYVITTKGGSTGFLFGIDPK